MRRFSVLAIAAAATLAVASPAAAQVSFVDQVVNIVLGEGSLAQKATVVAAILVMLGVSYLATRFGLNLSESRKDQLRMRIEEIIRGGVIWAAQKKGLKLDGNLSIAQKNDVIDLAATEYVPVHARQSVKKTGGDVDDVEMMKQIVAAKGMKTLETPIAAPTVVVVAPPAPAPKPPQQPAPQPTAAPLSTAPRR